MRHFIVLGSLGNSITRFERCVVLFQIQFHVDAHEVLSQENAGLKRSLEEELVRVGEQERGRRLSLEKRCADLEVVNDVLRQENLVCAVLPRDTHVCESGVLEPSL